MTEFSVVIPIYNEEENIHQLYNRLTALMDGLKSSYEVILVDDGSKDNSWPLIRELHDKDNRVKGLRFSRNFGHHIAITAGIDHARGNAVILMDGDLQDQPEEIPKLLIKFNEGYDLVYGIRKNRQDHFFKRLSSAFFWKMIRLLSGYDIPENQAMLRVMSRAYVDNFKKISERNRFLGGLFAWVGFNQIGVEIKHGQRFGGRSKYNLWKMIKLTFHAITSFSYFPLQLAGLVGLLISTISFIFGTWLIIRKMFLGISVEGWASIMVTILFIGGIQLTVLGLIGEYLGRVFSEVQNRPIYLLKDILH